jgi:hypothetical protein
MTTKGNTIIPRAQINTSTHLMNIIIIIIVIIVIIIIIIIIDNFTFAFLLFASKTIFLLTDCTVT